MKKKKRKIFKLSQLIFVDKHLEDIPHSYAKFIKFEKYWFFNVFLHRETSSI